MSEKVFFDDDGVTVTSARVIVGGVTYALSNITSCKSTFTEHWAVDAPRTGRRKKLYLLIGLAVGTVLGAVVGGYAGEWVEQTINELTGELVSDTVSYGITWGVVFLVTMWLSWKSAAKVNLQYKYRTYQIKFGTAAGEQQVLSSQNQEFIGRVVQAVNDAIVFRAGG